MGRLSPLPLLPSLLKGTLLPGLLLLGLPLLGLLGSSCASVDFTRETETYGRFVSKGWSFTIIGYDLPKDAVDIARENASDARQPNLVVEEVKVVPYLGPFDWLLDIICVRYARVTGTWGFPPKRP